MIKTNLFVFIKYLKLLFILNLIKNILLINKQNLLRNRFFC